MSITDWFTKNKLKNNSIYSVGEKIAEEYLTKNLDNFSKHVNEETLKIIWDQMREMIISISSQESRLTQIFMLRKHISETTNIRAEHEILLLNKNNDSNNWINEKGISGELHEHLHEICIINKLLGQSPDELNVSSEQAFSLITLGMYTASWYNEVLNALRSPLKDFEGTNDWYNSFLCSRLIINEDKYRKSINMEPMILKKELINAYDSFNKFVVDNHSNPFRAWKSEYNQKLKEGILSLPN
tara:strand:- start:627 stop:1355 length:729 start_codon:yes stop_codon:yes gene_type:complete